MRDTQIKQNSSSENVEMVNRKQSNWLYKEDEQQYEDWTDEKTARLSRLESLSQKADSGRAHQTQNWFGQRTDVKKNWFSAMRKASRALSRDSRTWNAITLD